MTSSPILESSTETSIPTSPVFESSTENSIPTSPVIESSTENSIPTSRVLDKKRKADEDSSSLSKKKKVTKYPSFECIDPCTWTFSAPIKDTTGKQKIWVNSPVMGEQLIFQLSKDRNNTTRFPFGANNAEQGVVNGKFNLPVSMDNKKLEEFITNFDAAIKKAAFDNHMKWFKRPITKSEIDVMYSSPFRESSKEGYAPILKVKLVEGNVKIEKCIDPLSDPVNKAVQFTDGEVSDIIPRSTGIVAVKVNQVWFINNKQFGVSLRAHHILLDKGDGASSEIPQGFDGLDS